MRELRSCDFCGAEAIGAFEIVPPELEPTETEQRRVVPCRDCKDRLETLLEPLLARAGAERGPDAADRDRDGRPTDPADGSEDVVASADRSTEKRRRTTSPNATVSDAAAERDERTGPRDGAGAEGDPDPGSGSQSGAPAESVLEDGITFERTERAAGDGSTESDETETGTAAAAGSTDQAADESPPDEAATTDAPSGPPTAYSKVIRLLRNREFPMERSAVEELAAGAYDLERPEAAAIVDYAVAEGEFVEKGGKLRRS